MAHEEGLVQNDKALRALRKGDEGLSDWISCMMYKPVYQNLIHLPVGESSCLIRREAMRPGQYRTLSEEI